MDAITQKKLQAELDYLEKRKAKADALGPEVISRTQDKYDEIIARIRELQAKLGMAPAPDKPVNPCIALIPVTFTLMLCKWLGIADTPADVEGRYTDSLRDIGAAFTGISDAIQATDVAAHVDAWTALDKAVTPLAARLRNDATAKQLGFTEVDCDGKCPFDQKRAV